MRRRSRPILTVLVLVLWLAAGPLAMLFAGCGAMGADCEGPCAVSPCLTPPAGGIARFDASRAALPGCLTHAALLLSAALEPPPKSLLLS
jgi:hypothetical protein